MVGSKKISMECFMCLFPFFGVFVDKRVSMQRHFDVKSELSIVRGGLKWAFKTLSNIWTEILSDLPCPLNPGWRIGHTNQARMFLKVPEKIYLTTKSCRIGNTNQARKLFNPPSKIYLTLTSWRICQTNQARKLFNLPAKIYLTLTSWKICNKRLNLFKTKSCSKTKLVMMTKRTSTKYTFFWAWHRHHIFNNNKNLKGVCKYFSGTIFFKSVLFLEPYFHNCTFPKPYILKLWWPKA